MKMNTDEKKNFLRFYLEPDLLTKEEVEKALKEKGIDVEHINGKAEKFLRKFEAKRVLEKAAEKKEEFLKLVEQFNSEEGDAASGGYKAAARKGASAGDGEVEDAKLLEFLKKRKQ